MRYSKVTPQTYAQGLKHDKLRCRKCSKFIVLWDDIAITDTGRARITHTQNRDHAARQESHWYHKACYDRMYY